MKELTEPKCSCSRCGKKWKELDKFRLEPDCECYKKKIRISRG
jgi:hypothetical protein